MQMKRFRLITKKDAVYFFKKELLPEIKQQEQQNGCKDTVLRISEWLGYINTLLDKGLITKDQFSSWAPPKDIC